MQGTLNPEWRLGFSVDVAAFGPAAELHVRIYDKDWVSADDFIGEATAHLADLQVQPRDLTLVGEKATGIVAVSAGSTDLLSQAEIQPSGFFEKLAPMGEMKSVKVDDITGEGPIRVATAPLPVAMRGIFWLTEQGRSSALASFAGPSKDGEGCSAGQLADGRYMVRVAGDRVWAFADNTYLSWKFVEVADLIYHFIFNDGENPTKCQIYPEARNLGATLSAEWILDFEGELMPEGSEEFKGSVVWKRPSFMFGKQIGEYALVQVMNEHGERLEPAWSKFAEYQASEAAGPRRGEIFYHEVS